MPAERERVNPFRRREFRAPHRRRALLVRLARPFLAALLLVGLPVGGLLWALSSPAFGLKEVTVSGGRQVSRQWVVEALRPLEGRHLLRLPLAEAERELLRHPWLERVRLRKELPRRLAVGLDERRPAALLRDADGGLHYVDRRGFVIAPLDPGLGAADLPLLSIRDRPAVEVPRLLALIDRWGRLAPAWAAGVSEVETLGDDDYRLWNADLPFPVRISGRRLETGLARFARLLPAIAERYPGVGEADLRFSHQIVLQPAVAAPLSSERG